MRCMYNTDQISTAANSPPPYRVHKFVSTAGTRTHSQVTCSLLCDWPDVPIRCSAVGWTTALCEPPRPTQRSRRPPASPTNTALSPAPRGPTQRAQCESAVWLRRWAARSRCDVIGFLPVLIYMFSVQCEPVSPAVCEYILLVNTFYVEVTRVVRWSQRIVGTG